MPKLPQVSSREILKVLYKLNFRIVSQEGSHIKLMRFVSGCKQTVIVPNHRNVKKGTLKSILRHIHLSVEDFIKLLR